MHILTKKFKFYKFQKSDLILSEIGCTVINVYIPSKKNVAPFHLNFKPL